MSDELSQAIADRIAVILAFTEPGDSTTELAEAVVDLVLADPTIRRWKAIAEAVDNEPEQILSSGTWKSIMVKSTHDAIYEHLRATGETI